MQDRAVLDFDLHKYMAAWLRLFDPQHTPLWKGKFDDDRKIDWFEQIHGNKLRWSDAHGE